MFQLSQFFIHRIIYILLVYNIVNINCVQAQPEKKNVSQAEIAYDKISKIYGNDQVLVNGVFLEYSSNDLGHPFFKKNVYSPGSINIRNKKYDNIKIKYDIYSQLVVVINPNQASDFPFTPPNYYISEFSIDNILFKKLKFREYPEQFYQVVNNGRIKCLYSWEKERTRSYHNARVLAYEYTSARRKSYLVINNQLMQYKSKNGFIKLFPSELAKQIKKFMKEEHIKLKTSTDSEISKLVSYCEALSTIKTADND